MTRGEELTARLAPVTLVVGKGGVGKTTVAAALGRAFATSGRRTLVVTTDPAATLLAAFDRPVYRTTVPVAIGDSLDAWAFDTAAIRDAFLARWRDPISTILDRGTYLDADDIRGLVDAALPGADEIFGVLALGDVLTRTEGSYERVVIDTAPTGHTLRLLSLPQSFDALVRLLDAMQEKHRFMVRALTHRYREDAADALIDDLRERTGNLRAILADRDRCRAVLVTRAEPVVEAESERYLAALSLAGIHVAAVIVNVASKAPGAEYLPKDGTFTAPLLPPDKRLEVSDVKPAAVSSGRSQKKSLAPVTHAAVIRDGASVAARSLTIVGGKGGVGKTTTSIALAIAAADAGHRTLIVSTDPAPSIADALAVPVGDDDTQVLPLLIARQIDATGAFAGFRDRYRETIDGLFERLAGKGLDVAHDREIIRDLLSLAPPGIDELYALTVIGEELAGKRFDRIVIDPAPTGHLLRLIDMPALATAWSHRIMRMMLKYREVVALGEAGEELLAFTKRTRALEERLRDPALAGALIVALDEPLVRGETARLARELEARRLPLMAILWNRASEAVPPLPTGASITQLFAPAASPPPVGADAIRRWAATWGTLTDDHS